MLDERQIMLSRPDAFAVWATQDDPPPLRFRTYRHIVYLASLLVEAIASGRGRLIVNMPPQHGKSWLLARWLVIWYLEQNPFGRVITASYSQQLVRGHARYVRNQLNQNPRLTTKVSADSKAADLWHTHTGHGGMLATTIGGQISGFPGDLLLIDDPYKGWTDAWSPTVRKHVRDWFDSELYARRQEHTTIIVLHTRWHPQDLTGYLLREHDDDWTLVRLPALAEPGEVDPLGREPGEPLCPQLHSEQDLRAAAGSQAIWQAVYQQDPKGLGDNRCYKQYSDERNLDPELKLRDGFPLHMAWDFNIRPGMHCVLGQHWHDRDELAAADELHGIGWDVRRTMDAFEQWWREQDGMRRFGSVEVFGDSSGRNRTHTTSESCYDLIAQKLQRMNVPFRVRVPSNAPGVLNSIDDFNAALCDLDGATHYRVHPRCERLLTDLRELGVDEYSHPDKSNPDRSHASDAERYRVTRLRPISRKAVQTGRVNV